MTVHRPHPITGTWNDIDFNDPTDAVLYDDCERCTEHATHIVSLDDNNLQRILSQAARTETERQAQGTIYRAQLVVESVDRARRKAE